MNKTNGKIMIKKLQTHFQDKKVLVTGHTGFKGSWLTTILLKIGANITGFSNEIPTNPSMFEILGLSSHINHLIGDIRDYGKINNTINEFKPEIIIHLAAQPLVRKSYLEPVETYQTNVMGTVNLLEAIKSYSKTTNNDIFVLNITSDKCYENKEKNYAYKEEDPLGGYDPYSSSKACSEIVTSAYRRSFFNNSNISLSSARAGNVIGGGDWSKDRIVVDCINALSKNQNIIVRSPKSLRPWQHVLEAISGYLDLITHMIDSNCSEETFNSPWNFGPYDTNVTNVETLVKLIIKNWGTGKYKIESNNDLHEAVLLQLDINKALSHLEWKPKLNMEKSVEYTVDWYKKNLSNEDMFNFTNKQANDYFKG